MPNHVEFFVVALPGLEDIVEAEIKDWFPDLETKLEHGGVTVKAPLQQGLAMNLALKTATRILLRVTQFRCRDFPKLFKSVSGFAWKEWIDPSCQLTVHASTRLSRLKIKKRIEETTLEAWQDYQKKQKAKPDKTKPASLYVRIQDDECTLSLDTSGERLHKRGARQHVGEAPLRETIAASLIQLVERKHATDINRPVEVIDPMMGSGTFLLEAAARDQLVEAREFGFETFASAPSQAPKLNVPTHAIRKLTGYEQDAKTLTAAKHNLQAVSGITLNLHGEDFFKSEPLPKSDHARWLFANPPYGERLKVKEPLGDFYARLFAAAESKVHPDRACFLLPAKAVHGKFLLPKDWKILEKRKFLNGGIPVIAFVFGRTAPWV
jgi:putative N6-adenine-specific DNA methylase